MAKQEKRPGRPPIAGPTARQQQILDFIRASIRDGQRPPSIDEIRRHFAFQSGNAVRTHLLSMEKKGLVKIARNSHRGLAIPDGDDNGPRPETRPVPLLGDAPAGAPAEALEQADEHIAVDRSLFPQDGLFAIRVRGDSMIEAGIHNRDVALIQPAADAGDGALVLARLNGEVTIKRLRFKKGKPFLHPENPDYPDMFVKAGDVLSIVGTVAGILRSY